MVEGAGKNLDTIMLTKAMRAADVQFVDLLLNQLEAKLKLERRIGIEVLIEEAAGLQNVEAIAAVVAAAGGADLRHGRLFGLASR